MKPESFSDISAKADDSEIWVASSELKDITFNDKTKFDNPEKALKILQSGMVPPLGVDKLHQKGVAGFGVNVAIIDQPIDILHPEYKHAIVYYAPTLGRYSSMHGPAVASLLVGDNIGVAPDAKLFYFAAPFYERNAKKCAEALDNMLFMNKTLPADKKIKFVSVSADLTKFAGYKFWQEMKKKAEEEGVLVIDCDGANGFVLPGFIDAGEFKYGCPDYKYNQEGIKGLDSRIFEELQREYSIGNRDIKEQVFAPAAHRTIAETGVDGKEYGYTYSANAGASWAIPYVTGLLCLGSQVAPDITAFELRDALIETADKMVVCPEKFIKKAMQLQEEKDMSK